MLKTVTSYVLYCLTSAINGVLAVKFGWGVQFNLQNVVNPTDLNRMYILQALLISGVVAGSFLCLIAPSFKIRANFRKPGIRYRNHALFLFILVVFAVSTSVSALHSFSISRSEIGIERVMGGKSSQFVLILCSLFAIMNVHYGKFAKFSVGIVIFISVLFAIGDGTRSSLIAPVLIGFYAVFSSRYVLFALSSVVAVIMIFFLSFGRILVSGGAASMSEILSSDPMGLLASFWHYFVTFSALHVAYATDISMPYFKLPELLYSIIPIPSSIIGPPSDPSTWRVDQFRPLGAQAELWGISPFFNFLFAAIFGFTAQKASRLSNNVSRALVSGILFLAFALSFQYGLRTVEWFFWLSVALVVFLSKSAKRAGAT